MPPSSSVSWGCRGFWVLIPRCCRTLWYLRVTDQPADDLGIIDELTHGDLWHAVGTHQVDQIDHLRCRVPWRGGQGEDVGVLHVWLCDHSPADIVEGCNLARICAPGFVQILRLVDDEHAPVLHGVEAALCGRFVSSKDSE